MGHRKWSQEKGCGLFSAEVNEHNALYDAWEVERERANDLLDDKRFSDSQCARLSYLAEQAEKDLDEARKRIAELEAPIRVPFSDAQIERMAKAAQPILYEGTKWHIIHESAKTALRQGVRAALAAGGLEPCAVPEYDPADVALRPSDEVAKLAQVLRDSYCKHYGITANGELPSHYMDHARAAIAHLRPTQGHVLRDRLVEAERKVDNQRAELGRMNALVADLRAEVDEDNAAAASVNDLLVQVQNLTAERDSLRERASVPVKVRWDVTAPEAANWIRSGGGFPAVTWMSENKYLSDGLIDAAMRYLAAHAVIDAPAGVPSVEELAKIIKRLLDEDGVVVLGEGAEEQLENQATAIRDAVLAGVAVELEELRTELSRMQSVALVPNEVGERAYDDQVEVLARVLCDAYCASNKNYGQEWDGLREIGRSHYMAEARAAIAHLSTRPHGLPTAEELAEIVHEVIMNPSLKSPVSPHIVEAILTALRPWLRDPVGCELDVTAEEMQEWLEPDSIGRRSSPHEILDLCRSRIRPVYECKECAKWEARYKEMKRWHDRLDGMLDAARAALEVE